MADNRTNRISRPLSREEQMRHAEIRRQVTQEFPPATQKKHRPVRSGIASELRKARKAQGLTYYAVAKLAGIPNSNTVKDIEYGRDAKLSNIEAIAKALGLKLQVLPA